MTILLTGGKGKTARRIATLLSASSTPHTYLVASRNGGGSGDDDGNGPSVKFDWLDAATYGNVFEHPTATASAITTVYIIQPPVPDPVPHVKAFIDYARDRGVRRFVMLSATSIEAGGPMHGQTHAYLKELGEGKGGVEWAVVRPPWFMENFSETHRRALIRDADLIYSATGTGKVPFISADDIAAVATCLLTAKGPIGAEYVVLGPELLSYDDIAAQLSKTLGRKITHHNISAEDLAARFHEIGIPKGYAAMLAHLDEDVAKGSEERLNGTVEEVTGRAPVRFADWVQGKEAVWERDGTAAAK